MAGFGAVTFTILANETERTLGDEDWQEVDHVKTVHIPGGTGGDSDVTFLMGVGSGTKKRRLLLDDQVDWAALKALRQTLATFVDWDGTSTSDVLLERLELPYTLPDDRQFVTATFRLTSGA